MSESVKNIFIVPVSGGSFPFQLSTYCRLVESDIFPDVCLTSSGGNAATYLILAADWNKINLLRIVKTLNSSMFLNSWAPTPVLGFSVGFFKGSAYSQGKGLDDFFRSYLVEESIKSLEIWTEAYNDTSKKSQVFCNKTQSSSLLRKKYVDCYSTQCLNPIYLNGDISKIAKVSLASASIPTMVPPVEIDGEYYIDGGVHSASPLNIMKNCIKALDNFHITHVVGSDINVGCKDYNQNIVETGITALDCLIKGFIKLDRTVALDLIRKTNVIPNQITFKGDKKSLDIIKFVKTKLNNSLLEVYPHYSLERLNLSSFEGQEIADKIQEGYENTYCRFWWIGDKDLCNEIELYDGPDCDVSKCSLIKKC